MFQWRRGKDGRVHLTEHRIGADAMRGRNRSFPDDQDSANTTSGYGSNGGLSYHDIMLYKHILIFLPQNN